MTRILCAECSQELEDDGVGVQAGSPQNAFLVPSTLKYSGLVYHPVTNKHFNPTESCLRPSGKISAHQKTVPCFSAFLNCLEKLMLFGIAVSSRKQQNPCS